MRWAIIAGLLMILILFAGSLFIASFDDDTKPRVFQAHLADLNGDGRLDVFLVYLNELNRVALNNGSGKFTVDRKLFMHSYALALGDLKGVGQLNAVVNNYKGQVTGLLCVNAPPGYALSGSPESVSSHQFAILDVNADGAAESFLAGCCKSDTAIFNYETFTDAAPCLGEQRANALALADLDGSGSLDAFLANGRMTNAEGQTQRKTPNEVWFNDGQGNFADSGQRLGRAESLAVLLGDVNGDGLPDAVVGNRGPDEVWLNAGQGSFHDSGQRLGSGLTHSLFLVDLDGDGKPDLFAAGDAAGQVWINNGEGNFRAGQRIQYARFNAIDLGDVTGDGVVDIFTAGVDGYRVWRGSGDGHFTPGPHTSYRDGP